MKRGAVLRQGGLLAYRGGARPAIIRILIASALGVILLAGESYGQEPAHDDAHGEPAAEEGHDDAHDDAHGEPAAEEGHDDAHDDGHGEVTEGEHHDEANDDAHDAAADAHDDAHGNGHADAHDDAHGNGHADAHDDAHPAPASSAGITQTECPVMLGEEIDPNFSTVYQGRRIYFCCKVCLAAFDDEPEKYLANVPPVPESAAAEGELHADADHDHATGHGQPQGLARLVRFVGKFHPIAVHFAIALVVAAALAEILAAATGSEVFRNAARFMIVFGAICVVGATALGWAAGAFASYPADYAQAFTRHRWAGMLTGVLAIIAAALCELSYRRSSRAAGVGYRFALALTVVLISVTGYLGGILVYGLRHYTW